MDASLIGAKMQKCDLMETRFTGVDFAGADLTEAYMGWTVFCDCDLSNARGLATVRHGGPTALDIRFGQR